MDLQQNKPLNFNGGQSWWIVFKDARTPFVKAITRKGFGHCFVLTRMNNVVLAIEPHLGTVNHILTDADLADILAEQKLDGARVVHLRHEPEASRFKVRAPMITCASYIAYTMGIPYVGLWPCSLYRKVMRMGGELI